ncbi:MAG: cob(I)yrinic acid a,c-diamide adenosyltransferase [Deltaproteobacteria bacterium]|nr:cob(I)yrinic acid a,c-diamide adenosyltransferase [Deltaproteobacteria bacterium]
MAIRITKVYTRTGDKGFTKLVGGKKVPKDAVRIEAYGTIDELNSVLGLSRVFNDDLKDRLPAAQRLDEIFRRLQNELFDVGSELATPPDFSYEGQFHVGDDEVKALEKLIDELQKDLTPLNSFILPGGGKVGGFLHQARTVCRRAEREILRLSREEELSPWPLKYVNRLSDLLFVLSRWVSKNLGEPEYLWERGLRGHDREAKAASGKRNT